MENSVTAVSQNGACTGEYINVLNVSNTELSKDGNNQIFYVSINIILKLKSFQMPVIKKYHRSATCSV
jgi:hypothetical protein